jgi:hypothetical protein
LVEPNFELILFYIQIRIKDFTLQFISTSKSGIKIVVHDVLGRKIFEKAMIYSGNYDYYENIQLVNTQPGLYFLTIIDGSKGNKKILIQ